MKLTFNPAAIAFAATVFISLTPARCQSNLPTSSWEQLSEGVAVALGWTDNQVTISIKNTSSSLKVILEQGPFILVKLYYINEDGAQIPLGNHIHNAMEDRFTLKTSAPIDLPPDGQVATSMAKKFTSDELILIKTQPVMCSMLIYEPATKQKYSIESTPKILVQKVSVLPNK